MNKGRTLFGSLTNDERERSATADLSEGEAAALYSRIYAGKADAKDVELFQAQMLTEMAGMSVEDGLTMQLDPGSIRNHNQEAYETFGRDKGADIPSPTEYVRSLRPLLINTEMSRTPRSSCSRWTNRLLAGS